MKTFATAFVLTLSSSILAASSTAAEEYRLDCASVLEKMGVPSIFVGAWINSVDTEVQQIIDMQCSVASASKEKVEFMCPILDQTAENPEGLGPITVESQGNFLDSKANLIILGNVMGECASMEVK
jgi:hypothetical protein